MPVRVRSLESVFLRRTSQAYRNHKKRAAKFGYNLPYTLEELRAEFSFPMSNMSPCAYCRGMMTVATFCLDHDWPVGRKVDHLTWNLDNLVACCKRCNECKDRLTSEEFRELMALVLRFPMQAQTNIFARLRAGARRVAGRG